MSNKYILAHGGFREVSDDELMHYKYIKREKKPGGGYKYWYYQTDKNAMKTINGKQIPTTKTKVATNTQPKVSKEYQEELAYNSKKNVYSAQSKKDEPKKETSKPKTSAQPKVSKEYQQEVAYNSKKNVFPSTIKENVIRENKIYENVIREDKANTIIKSKTSFSDLLKNIADSALKSLSKAGDRMEDAVDAGKSWLEKRIDKIDRHFGEYVDAVRSGDEYGEYLSKKKTSDLYKKWYDRSVETTNRIQKKVDEGRLDPRDLEISKHMDELYYKDYQKAQSETHIAEKQYQKAKTLKGKVKAVGDVFEDHVDDHLFEAEYLLKSLLKKRK